MDFLIKFFIEYMEQVNILTTYVSVKMSNILDTEFDTEFDTGFERELVLIFKNKESCEYKAFSLLIYKYKELVSHTLIYTKYIGNSILCKDTFIKLKDKLIDEMNELLLNIKQINNNSHVIAEMLETKYIVLMMYYDRLLESKS
jgi:hypothetical protein